MILIAKETVFYNGNRVRKGQTVEIGEGETFNPSLFSVVDPQAPATVGDPDEDTTFAGRVTKKVKKHSDEALP